MTQTISTKLETNSTIEEEVKEYCQGRYIAHSGKKYNTWDVLNHRYKTGEIYFTGREIEYEKDAKGTSDVNNIRNVLLRGFEIKRDISPFMVYDSETNSLIEREFLIVSDGDLTRFVNYKVFLDQHFREKDGFIVWNVPRNSGKEDKKKSYNCHVNVFGVIEKGEYIFNFKDSKGYSHRSVVNFSVDKDKKTEEFTLNVDDEEYPCGTITIKDAFNRVKDLCREKAEMKARGLLDDYEKQIIFREEQKLKQEEELREYHKKMEPLLIKRHIESIMDPYLTLYGNNDEYICNSFMGESSAVEHLRSYATESEAKGEKVREVMKNLPKKIIEQHQTWKVTSNLEDMSKVSSEHLRKCETILHNNMKANGVKEGHTESRNQFSNRKNFSTFAWKIIKEIRKEKSSRIENQKIRKHQINLDKEAKLKSEQSVFKKLLGLIR